MDASALVKSSCASSLMAINPRLRPLLSEGDSFRSRSVICSSSFRTGWAKLVGRRPPAALLTPHLPRQENGVHDQRQRKVDEYGRRGDEQRSQPGCPISSGSDAVRDLREPLQVVFD